MAELIRIAVCDDARAVKMFFRHVLEEEGDMEVVSSTSSGRAALDEMGRHPPHALLLDLALPPPLPPRRPAPPRPRPGAGRALAAHGDPPHLEHAGVEPPGGGRAT